MRSLIVIALVAACAHNTPQDLHTGDDGRPKGARPLKLVNNEARAVDIVTYPGGDRVDWKVLELPAKTTGRLEFTLTWDVPRPGLRLAFDVFDQYYKPVAASAKPKDRSNSRVRDAAVDNAIGKYFIRVYAERRRDAGRYKLVAQLKTQGPGKGGFDPLSLKVADPPPLGDLPTVEDPCTNDNFDIKKKSCKNVCPDPRSLAPRDWKPCAKICDTPDIENSACWSTMDCPAGKPDRRVRKCTVDKFPPCNFASPDPGNPRCDKRDPITARINRNSVASGVVTIYIAAGADQGVTTKWSGYVLAGASDRPLPNGELKIVTVDRSTTTATVQLTTNQVSANQKVRLLPPKP